MFVSDIFHMLRSLQAGSLEAPNSPGVSIDAPRTAKIGGPILSASSDFLKSPPIQHHDEHAHDLVEAFIAGEIER